MKSSFLSYSSFNENQKSAFDYDDFCKFVNEADSVIKSEKVPNAGHTVFKSNLCIVSRTDMFRMVVNRTETFNPAADLRMANMWKKEDEYGKASEDNWEELWEVALDFKNFELGISDFDLRYPMSFLSVRYELANNMFIPINFRTHGSAPNDSILTKNIAILLASIDMKRITSDKRAREEMIRSHENSIFNELSFTENKTVHFLIDAFENLQPLNLTNFRGKMLSKQISL